MDSIRQNIFELKGTLDLLLVEKIHNVISLLHNARLDNQQVFTVGNGGSASTASHFVCGLSKNTRKKAYPPFRVLGLTDNMTMLSASADEEGFENVFSKQLVNLLQVDDIVIGISTSGNSMTALRKRLVEGNGQISLLEINEGKPWS